MLHSNLLPSLLLAVLFTAAGASTGSAQDAAQAFPSASPQSQGLSGRRGHALAYNAARQRVVPFGALSLTPGMQIPIGD